MDETLLDHLHTAWGVIANVSGGRWEEQSDEWCAAAEKWRDEFHAILANTRQTEESLREEWGAVVARAEQVAELKAGVEREKLEISKNAINIILKDTDEYHRLAVQQEQRIAELEAERDAAVARAEQAEAAKDSLLDQVRKWEEYVTKLEGVKQP